MAGIAGTSGSGMSRRSLVIALIFAAVLSGVAFFNDQVAQNTYIIGNYLPIGVFGPLILFTLLINPLLRRLKRGAAFRAAELAGLLAVLLFACYPMGRGFIHYFTTFLMLPHHHLRTRPAWQGDPARISETAVRDWRALAAALADARQHPPGDPLRELVERLPAGLRSPNFDEVETRAAWLEAVNAVLSDPLFSTAVRLDALTAPLPRWARWLYERDSRCRTEAQTHALNRGLLDAALGDRILAPRRPGVLENVPPRLLADPTRDPLALEGFVTGLAEPGRPFSPSMIPWRAWGEPLGFWIPLLGAMALTVIGLSLVLHRQWAINEHLPYPSAEFARALLPDNGASVAPIFRQRLFWIGFLPVFGLHLVNYAHAWWPEYVIPIQRTLDFRPLLDILPVFRRGGAHIIFQPTLYFTAIGFAYFLSSDVSFSLGIAPYIFVGAAGTAAVYGISFSGGHLQPHIESSLYAGATVAMFLAIVYSGRRHLFSTFARALGLRRGDPSDPFAIGGARVALLGFALFVVQLVFVGVEWPLAMLYTLLSLMIFTVMSRLLVEAGVFFFHPHFYACGLLWAFLGTAAIGPDQLLLLGMVSSLLLIDPREALMPYAVTALKIADDARLPLGRVARAGGAALLLATVIAVPTALYWQYREGAVKTGDGWTVQSVPTMVFNVNVSAVRTLEAQGRLESSRRLSVWARFREAAPQRVPTIAFSVSFALVLLCAFLRRRFPRWPLHPLLFLMGAHWQSRNLAFSFLLGWAVKTLLMKYGGARAYRQAKPVAVGLVAGEVLAALIPLLVGAAYYAATGRPPIPYRIMPG